MKASIATLALLAGAFSACTTPPKPAVSECYLLPKVAWSGVTLTGMVYLQLSRREFDDELMKEASVWHSEIVAVHGTLTDHPAIQTELERFIEIDVAAWLSDGRADPANVKRQVLNVREDLEEMAFTKLDDCSIEDRCLGLRMAEAILRSRCGDVRDALSAHDVPSDEGNDMPLSARLWLQKQVWLRDRMAELWSRAQTVVAATDWNWQREHLALETSVTELRDLSRAPIHFETPEAWVQLQHQGAQLEQWAELVDRELAQLGEDFQCDGPRISIAGCATPPW